MLKFAKFKGINNVLPSERLTPDRNGEAFLAEALNVDVGLDMEIRRRGGFVQRSNVCHKNLWNANGFQIATVNGDLTAIAPDGTATLLYAAYGTARVWYVDMPDGRTAFSNGSISGITDGHTFTPWGVPIPAAVGALTEVPGSLYAGDYRYAIAYVRTSDGLEGGCAFADRQQLAQGGFTLMGLPQLAGYSINVYVSSHNDDSLWLAGNTTTAMFAFTGANDDLQLENRHAFVSPAPAGILCGMWKGRSLIAVGDTLYASRQHSWEAFELRRDYKRFPGTISLVMPLDDGIFIGTENELAFMAGREWDKLMYDQKLTGLVALGSGVKVDGERIEQGEGATGHDDAMMCIADGMIVAGFTDGHITRISQEAYKTDAVEVAATFRVTDTNLPQYIAVKLA